MTIDYQTHADAFYAAFGQAASYRPRSGPTIPVTVRRARAPELISIGGAEFQGDGFVWVIRKSEVAEPAEQDCFQLADGRLFVIQAEPRLFGRRELQWMLDCHQRTRVA